MDNRHMYLKGNLGKRNTTKGKEIKLLMKLLN